MSPAAWPFRILRQPKMVAAAGVAMFVTLWLLAHYRPTWYLPAVLNEAQLQQARKHAIAEADWVSARMVKRAPFELTLEARTVNEWLAALPSLWPGGREAFPPQLAGAAVSFGEHGIQFAVHYTGQWWQSIVSVNFTVELSDGGRLIHLRLGRPRGGCVPISHSVLIRVVEPMLLAARGESQTGEIPNMPDNGAWPSAQSIVNLFEGVQVENRFVWINGDRPFRFRFIKLDNGKLHLGIEPL